MILQGFTRGRENPDTPHVREYYSRMQLLDGWQNLGCARGLVNRPDLLFEVPELLRLILDIRGVTFAHLEVYKVIITKAEAFEWHEIEIPLAALMLGVDTAIGTTEEIERTIDAAGEARLCSGSSTDTEGTADVGA